MIVYIQYEERKTQCSYNLADTKLTHYILLSRCVDRTTNVDSKVEDTYLEGHQQLAPSRPVLGVLQPVSNQESVNVRELDAPLGHFDHTNPPT